VGWFYVGKLLWPTDLIFFYPRWLIDAARAEQWIFPIATALLLAVLAWGQKHQRAPLAAALLYGGTLFPVLGFVNVYPFVFSYVADHFQYLASLSMIAFLVAVAQLGWARWRGPNGSGFVVATLGLLLLGGLTWQQCGMYRDGRTLYETTLERNPESWVAHLNLGIILDEAGETEKSLVHLQRARELKPNFPETLNTLGNVLNRLGRSREALPWLEQAVKLQPRFAAAHNGRGAALMSLGRAEEGITAFRRAVELDPTWALPRLNLAWAMANHGRVTEAMVEFEQVRRLQPELAEAETKWGLAWVLHGQVDEALPHLKRAVALQPDDPDVHHNLARVLLRAGQRTAAIAQFETVLRLNPNHNAASEALAALRQSGSTSP
jgi:tetratricopeptide (TPR) repeat protein